MSEQGFSVQPIYLNGRYHHPSNTKVAEQVKLFCKQDKRFQLPNADQLIVPLRSNANAYRIVSGALHEIALDSILTIPSQWYETLKGAVADLGQYNINTKVIGPRSILPRSMSSALTLEPLLTDGLKDESIESPVSSNESAPDSSTPNHSSCPTPLTEVDVNTEDLSTDPSAIAVVGMACRFPKAESLNEYWRLLCSGENAAGPIPYHRFNPEKLWRNPKGPFWGNFLKDPDVFDHRFFSVTAREAKSMDPQQRLLLQVVYEALDSSGYYGSYQGSQTSRVGCYVGVGSVDYEDNVASADATAFSALGTLRAFISGRVSHFFGWSGPSITYDTACSSSAVAIHSACKVSQLLGLCYEN